MQPLTNNVFYHPYDGGSEPYLSAYQWFSEKSSRYNFHVIFSAIKIAFLPFRSVIIVEALSSITWIFFLRLDLKVVHIPRGGASLKVGWSTNRQLNWKTYPRLRRRSYVVYRNKFIARYYSLEEGGNHGKALVGPEIIDEYLKARELKKNEAHIALSECWEQQDLVDFVEQIHAAISDHFSISLSLHPLMLDRCKDLLPSGIRLAHFGEQYLPGVLITDCVSLVFLAHTLNIDIWVVPERQEPTRDIIVPQDTIFCMPKNSVETVQLESYNLKIYKGGSSLLNTHESMNFTSVLNAVFDGDNACFETLLNRN